MSIDFSTKPKVTVHLDPVHEAYCRYIFKTPSDQDEIFATRRHPIGQRLSGLTDSCRYLKRDPSVKNQVVFILPTNPVNKTRFKSRFLKVTDLDKQTFNDFVHSEFNLWSREEFYRGYEILKWDQKTIVDAICRKLNVRNNAVNSATITKNDYRSRVYVERQRAELLAML